MPTIAFVSPKGGVGKTTSAFLLATALTTFQDVTIIDADPNHPIESWARGGNTPPGLTIISDVDEDTIIEKIEDAASTPMRPAGRSALCGKARRSRRKRPQRHSPCF
jgi:chromosome partitioning protein